MFGFGSGSMISNLNGSGSVRVHRKKRFLPVRGSGSGSIRLPGCMYRKSSARFFKVAR